MKAGFYIIMAAQFFSSLADNALLVAAIQMLRDLESPAWMTPSLKQVFVISYVLLAPLVGAFADSMPKGRVMLITNGIKICGCGLMLFTLHPLMAYALVGLGAAAYQRVGHERVQREQHQPAAADLDAVGDQHHAALRHRIGECADERREQNVGNNEDLLERRRHPGR